jgi:hypothetical protein
MVSMEIQRIFKDKAYLLAIQKYFQATSFKDLRITNNDYVDDTGMCSLCVSISRTHYSELAEDFHRKPSIKSRPIHMSLLRQILKFSRNISFDLYRCFYGSFMALQHIIRVIHGDDKNYVKTKAVR